MAGESTDSAKVYVVLNPVAGNSDVDLVTEALEAHFSRIKYVYEVYHTTGKEEITKIVEDAIDEGFNLFIAAGGDGTVSGVAGGLLHTDIPFGIIPLGTGNALARELKISLKLEEALGLIVDDRFVRSIDVMQAGERYFVLNISIGLGALVMRDTENDAKRQLGLVAYILQGLGKLFGFQPWRFTIDIDGKQSHVRASEIAIVNAGALGVAGMRWGEHIYIDDGQIDVCIVNARSLLDYIRLAWESWRGTEERDPATQYLKAKDRVVVNSRRHLPAQGDGEYIGHTPVEVQVIPAALRVITPPEK